LGERLLCKQEVIGSIPFTSTISPGLRVPRQAQPLLRRKGSGGRGTRRSLRLQIRSWKHSLPAAPGLTACSLTCEERSVTETGVSFAEV
jgi:hypothetical protein